MKVRKEAVVPSSEGVCVCAPSRRRKATRKIRRRLHLLAKIPKVKILAVDNESAPLVDCWEKVEKGGGVVLAWSATAVDKPFLCRFGIGSSCSFAMLSTSGFSRPPDNSLVKTQSSSQAVALRGEGRDGITPTSAVTQKKCRRVRFWKECRNTWGVILLEIRRHLGLSSWLEEPCWQLSSWHLMRTGCLHQFHTSCACTSEADPLVTIVYAVLGPWKPCAHTTW